MTAATIVKESVGQNRSRNTVAFTSYLFGINSLALRKSNRMRKKKKTAQSSSFKMSKRLHGPVLPLRDGVKIKPRSTVAPPLLVNSDVCTFHWSQSLTEFTRRGGRGGEEQMSFKSGCYVVQNAKRYVNHNPKWNQHSPHPQPLSPQIRPTFDPSGQGLASEFAGRGEQE